MPDSISVCAEPTVPAASITSVLACTVCMVSFMRNCTATARLARVTTYMSTQPSSTSTSTIMAYVQQLCTVTVKQDES